VVLGKAMAMWQLTFARTGEASGAVVGNGQCVGWARMAGDEKKRTTSGGCDCMRENIGAIGRHCAMDLINEWQWCIEPREEPNGGDDGLC
jgi:hypothetical protein